MGGLHNEPHIEKYYVVPLSKDSKFSSDPPPDLQRIMTIHPLFNAGYTLSLLGLLLLPHLTRDGMLPLDARATIYPVLKLKAPIPACKSLATG